MTLNNSTQNQNKLYIGELIFMKFFTCYMYFPEFADAAARNKIMDLLIL